jgi:hypothetical protein
MTSVLKMGRSQHQAPAALPMERPGTHCTGVWVGPRAGLDGCGKPQPQRDSIPDSPAHSESQYRLSYRGRNDDLSFDIVSTFGIRSLINHKNLDKINAIIDIRYIVLRNRTNFYICVSNVVTEF